MYGELWAWAVDQPARAAVVAAVVGLPVVGLVAQQRQADQRKAGRASAAGAGGGGVLGRFLTGRDLRPGEPASSATWWCAGVEVVRDRTAADIVTGGPEPARKAPAGRGGVLRALVAGAGRWGCWPGAARCAVRLGVPVVVVAGWAGWWSAVAAVVGLLAVAGLVVAVTGPAVLGRWRPLPASADLVHGPGMWTALRPVLGVVEGERRGRWLHLPQEVTETGARIVLRLPAGWAGGDAGMRGCGRSRGS